MVSDAPVNVCGFTLQLDLMVVCNLSRPVFTGRLSFAALGLMVVCNLRAVLASNAVVMPCLRSTTAMTMRSRRNKTVSPKGGPTSVWFWDADE